MIFYLPEVLIIDIMILLIAQDPKSYGALKQSCIQMRRMADDPWVLKNININLLSSKLPNITNFDRFFLSKLQIRKVPGSSLLIGTDLFFRQDEEQGLIILNNEAKNKNPQAIYNYAIALITSYRQSGYMLLKHLLDIPDDRLTLAQVRNNFRQMLSDTSKKRLTYTNWCPMSAEGHWNRDWEEIIGENELKINCVHCCMDIEMFKLKTTLH
ncbi:hypothetical protein ACFE04_030908 [Oxalis oulophora]